ncbi:MAG TPA: GxxExxY protein [Anaerolineae bacterium]|nr:GxxExxY protein [Anaerolineae bacterium]
MDTNPLNQVTDQIIGAAIEVHRLLGPGLLESAYEACLAYELAQRNLKFEQQKPLPITYKQVKLDCGYRLDFLIEENVIVELKSVDQILPIYEAQLLSYLKISNKQVGLLINFNTPLLKQGVRRIVNGFQETPRSLRSRR